MSTAIRTRKGANITLNGEAEKIIKEYSSSPTIAIQPDNFFGLTPKLLVKEGAAVAKGEPVFFDKSNASIQFVAPVAGELTQIQRGPKRKIEALIFTPKGSKAVTHKTDNWERLDRSEAISLLLESGNWPFLSQRPYGTIANPEASPKALFISAYASAPLDVDFDFLLKNNKKEFQLGIDFLTKLVPQIFLSAEASFGGFFEDINNVTYTPVSGPHPAGNLSVQIHNLAPLNMGETVWTIRPEDVVNIGLFLTSGVFSSQRTIAIAGGAVEAPQYIKTEIGTQLSGLLEIGEVNTEKVNRYINGDVLSGAAISVSGHLGYYNNLVSVIPEGNNYRMFGWLPFVDNHIPSLSKTSLSWLFGKKKFNVDTNLNGEERALVVTGEMESVFPMDIFPMQLIKACLIGDIEKMEALGIYEVVPEDFGLVDYANTSKIEAQEIIKDALTQMIKEVG